MRAFASLVAILFAGILFAGCSGKTPVDTETLTSRPQLAADKGGITGLLIDDIYRPIAGALILLQGGDSNGLTATSDDRGQFEFTDIVPGSYIALASAEAHEAAPVNVDVRAGEYVDLEVSARRLFSQDGTLITTEYSIFTACAWSGVLVSQVVGCIADDDSYRPGLHMGNFSETNITYLVTEVKLNQPDNYIFVARCSGGGSFGCGEYAYTNISQSDPLSKGVYGKLVLKLHENYMHTWQSFPWNNTDAMDMLVFYKGQGYETVQPVANPAGCTATQTVNGAPDPVPNTPSNPLNGKPLLCREYYGAGARAAVQGRIIMSLFLGEPKVPIEEYHTLSPPA